MNRRRTLILVAVLAAMLVSAPVLTASTAAAADPCDVVRDEVARRTALLDAASAAGGLTSSQRDQVARERAINRAALRRCTPTPTPTTPGASPTPVGPSPSIPNSPTPTVGPSPAASPSPSPTDPVAECPAFPAMPDASCTGWQHTGVTLRTCHEADGEDDNHLTVPQVFDGCALSGFLRIRSAGIVIKRSRIEGNLAPHWSTPHQYFGLQLIDVEITTAVADNAPVGDGDNYSCLRCYVHDTSTGLGGGNGVSIVDSYVTRMVYSTGAHQATVGMAYGRGIVVRHNNLDCYRIFPPGVPTNQGCSAALSLYDEGAMDGVLVEQNLFNAAGEYCVYTGGPTARNVVFRNNRFGRVHHPACGNSGPVHSWYPDNEGYRWENNTWADTGAPVNP